MQSGNGQTANPWWIVTWTVAVLLPAAPLVAMHVTDEAKWTLIDFVVMGVVLALGRHAVYQFVRGGHAGRYLAPPASAEPTCGNAGRARSAAQHLEFHRSPSP